MGKIAEQLRRAVQESGQSLYAIANATDMSQGILSRFMRSERTMTLDTAEKLTDYLGLELQPKKQRGKKPRTGRKKASKK